MLFSIIYSIHHDERTGHSLIRSTSAELFQRSGSHHMKERSVLFHGEVADSKVCCRGSCGDSQHECQSPEVAKPKNSLAPDSVRWCGSRIQRL